MKELILNHKGENKAEIINKVMSELKINDIQSYEKKELSRGTKKITIYYGG